MEAKEDTNEVADFDIDAGKHFMHAVLHACSVPVDGKGAQKPASAGPLPAPAPEFGPASAWRRNRMRCIRCYEDNDSLFLLSI